jgi:hypothetical protein
MMKVDCQEHRKTMELLSLRVKLEKGISDADERKEVQEKIMALERELHLN